MQQQSQPQGAAPQTTSKWTFDPGNSCVSFVVRHYGIAFARGIFNKVQAQLEFDPANITGSTVSATIETASINTNNERRDNDLRDPRFLDVQAHPTMTFKSKRIQSAGEKKYQMIGDLTIKGVTKEVTFDLVYGGTTMKDARGTEHAGFTAEATINRKDFKVDGDVLMPDGMSTVADHLKINLDIELKK